MTPNTGSRMNWAKPARTLAIRPLQRSAAISKARYSVLLYAAAVVLAFVDAWLSIAIYVLVAVMWLIPTAEPKKGCARVEEIFEKCHVWKNHV